MRISYFRQQKSVGLARYLLDLDHILVDLGFASCLFRARVGSGVAITATASVMAAPRPGKLSSHFVTKSTFPHLNPQRGIFQTSTHGSENDVINFIAHIYILNYLIYLYIFPPSQSNKNRSCKSSARLRNPLHGGSGAPRAPLALRRTRVCACYSHVS